MGLSLKVQWSVKRGVGVCGLHVMRIRGPEGPEDAPHLSNYTLHATWDPTTDAITLDLSPAPDPSDSTCGGYQAPDTGSGRAGE